MVEIGRAYVLEEFRLEPEKRSLSRHDAPVRLANQPFQILLYLIENRDRVVTRDELLSKFWNSHGVYDESLTKSVGAIRKALNENSENPRFIETRWREGYRFIGQVEEVLTHFTPAVVEIEKIREVKLVIHEEENSDPPDSGEIIHASPVHVLPFRNRLRISRRWMAIGAGLVLLIGAGVFLFAGNGFNRANPAAGRNSIAVMPFKSLPNDPNSDYFGDGMTESLIASLSKVDGLKVISRSSVFAFKSKETDPREIGRQLGAATILEGTIRRNGDKIRIGVSLVDTADGQILWTSDDYERSLGDVFIIQDDIAQSVTTRLRLKLSPPDNKRTPRKRTDSVEAYQAYLKGRYFWNKKDTDGLAKAHGFFQEALRLDPNYAEAYVGLSNYYTSGIWYFPLEPKDAIANAKVAAERSLELDPNLSDAHLARSNVACLEWDWDTCRREQEKAIELDTNNAQAFQAYAFYLSNIAGRPDDAISAIKKARELDPLSVSINTDVGCMYNRAGRFDAAIEAFNKSLEIDPAFDDIYYNLGIAYERKGMGSEAVNAYLEGWKKKMDSDRLDAFRSAFEQSGIQGFWRKHLEFMQQDSKMANASPAVSPYFVARIQSLVGNRDQSLDNLEKSLAAHEPYLVGIKSDFAFDALRSEPRYYEILRKIGAGS